MIKSGWDIYLIFSKPSFKNVISNIFAETNILLIEDIQPLDRNINRIESPITYHELRSCDRILRNTPWEKCFQLFDYSTHMISNFLKNNKIHIISSGRDTWLQLLCLNICKNKKLLWMGATYTKYPPDYSCFTSTYHAKDFILNKTPLSTTKLAAKNLLEKIRLNKVKAPAKKAPTNSFEIFNTSSKKIKYFINNHGRNYLKDRKVWHSRFKLLWLVKKFLSHHLNYIVVNSKFKKELPSEPYVLYPLHKQPESAIDVQGKDYSDQLTTIKSIRKQLPAKYRLAVKVHKSATTEVTKNFLSEIKNIGKISILDSSLDMSVLISKSEAIITVCGSTGYEAALFGKPVLTLVDMFWSKFPTVKVCGNLKNLKEDLDTVIKASKMPESELKKLTIYHLAYIMENSYHCLINRSFQNKSLLIEDLKKLELAYHEHYLYYNTINIQRTQE